MLRQSTYTPLDPDARKALVQLTPLLRIADSLDRGHRQHVASQWGCDKENILAWPSRVRGSRFLRYSARVFMIRSAKLDRRGKRSLTVAARLCRIRLCRIRLCRIRLCRIRLCRIRTSV